MSKSKNNGVDPEAVIKHYGADTVRLFTMFAAPPEQGLEWTDSGVEGGFKFLRRLWKTVVTHCEAGSPGALITDDLNDTQKNLRRKTHQTIQKVSDDFGRRQTFNTAIAAVMELLNEVNKHADRSTPNGLAIEREALDAAVLMLSPIVPHICHSLWQALGHESVILDAPWPSVDESALIQDSLTIVAQVNGKVRGKVEAPVDADQDSVLQRIQAEPNVQKFLQDKRIIKVILVPNKLINIVVK